ncbi:hypothetical protein ScPMuIL_003481, partial [Solemya velum]
MLVMTGIDFEQKEQLYDQTCQSLRKFKGQATGGATGGTMSTTPIKVEPTYMASTSSNRYYRRPRNFNTPNKRMDKTKERKINPKGPDGQLLTCRACGSFRHLIRECPDSWENLSKVNIATVDSETYPEEHVVLFTGYNKPEVTQLDMEASNCAILDSACSSTVCGKDWMENYVDSLSEEEKASVKRFEGSRIFKFGGGTTLHSKGEYEIPATIVSNSVRIWTDVVDSHIPLLLSREAMKKAEVRLDIRNDSAEIFGKQVSLNVTSSGHYCVYLQKEIPVEDVCVVNLEEISNEEHQKVILKLHRQFAHPPEKRLIAFMKDAGAWKEDYRSLVSSIQSSCDLCKMYMKTLPRPVVSMPMATKLNEKVAMDLKQWGNSGVPLKKDNKMHKLLEEAKTCIDHWNKNEGKLYLPTPSLEKCQKILTEEGHLNIFGLSGQGKTALAYNLIEAFEHSVFLSSPEEWRQIDKEKCKLIILDDIFGRFRLNNSDKENWIKHLVA